MVAGVVHYAQKAGWRIQTIPYAQVARDRRINESPESDDDIAALIDLWKPNGYIVQGPNAVADELAKVNFGKAPVIFLDSVPKSLPQNAFCVYSDSSAVAKAAARELLSLGLENFAFIDWWQDEVWSRERGQIFEATLAAHGKRCLKLKFPSLKDRANEGFARATTSLPIPCGVFCANDVVASRFVSETSRLGFGIPDDFAVIGVDNDRELCETAPVSISSIPQDCFGAGRLAAELLDCALSRHPAPEPKVKFGILPVARRASTRLLQRNDARVSAALEYIRLNACTAEINVGAVADSAKCSRRQLDALFRSLVRHSVLDEIHARRIERASQLLKQGSLAIFQIANQCGYRSASDFSRAFKRETGKPPSARTKGKSPIEGARKPSPSEKVRILGGDFWAGIS